MSGLVLWIVLLGTTGVTGFNLAQEKDSQSHWEITEAAILEVTAKACSALARDEGRNFTLPERLTAQSLLEACSAKGSARQFAINKFHIKSCNSLVNIDHALIASHHFDDESFDQGKTIITAGLHAVKANIQSENYDVARCTLGEILHTLQDFYSHSNWIEMGNDRPNTNLIKEDASLGTITGKDRPTCRTCTEDCNILDDILEEKLLTSGYFSPGASNNTPKGKCSHGASQDTPRHNETTDGINKDSNNSSHGGLHMKAAQVATNATSELLDDVLSAVGHKNFLRMMGVSPGKALCFVIDTTGSMGYDIETIRFITHTFISNLKGTVNEPSVYVLVTFNDPDFGPVIKTTNLNQFKDAIYGLRPSGGGDEPEMSLSGLQLALNAVPMGSEIYVFTDATAKDAHLKNSIIALVQKTQCVVNFVISKVLLREPIYAEVAIVSGGQVVKVSKDNVYPAITVFLSSSYSNLVTLLQAVRNPGEPALKSFDFSVNEIETNVCVFITDTKDFTLISPTGAVQKTITGSLTTSSETVGNLLVLNLKNESGQWKINITSTGAFTLKIMAQSSIDFFCRFMKPSEMRSAGYAVNPNMPSAGENGTLMLVVPFGGDTISLTEVNLVNSSGMLNGTLMGQENNEYLVQFDQIPSEEFNVQVTLREGSHLTIISKGNFQRYSTQYNKASLISVTTSSPDTVFEPGSTSNTEVTVSTQGTKGLFTIRASMAPDVANLVFPSTLMVGDSGANATIQITFKNITDFCIVVTLTVEAVAPNGSDFNYAVSTFTLIREVTDIHSPVFELNQTLPEPNCRDLSSTWQIELRVTDSSIIKTVYVREGNGALKTNQISGNETVASYNASCRFPTVKIVAVDDVGNVGHFLYNATVRQVSSTNTKPTSDNSTPVTRATTKQAAIANTVSKSDTKSDTSSRTITIKRQNKLTQATTTTLPNTSTQTTTTTLPNTSTQTTTTTLPNTSTQTTTTTLPNTSTQTTTTTLPNTSTQTTTTKRTTQTTTTKCTSTTQNTVISRPEATNNQHCVLCCLYLIISLLGIQVFN